MLGRKNPETNSVRGDKKIPPTLFWLEGRGYIESLSQTQNEFKKLYGTETEIKL